VEGKKREKGSGAKLEGDMEGKRRRTKWERGPPPLINLIYNVSPTRGCKSPRGREGLSELSG
jgi:hypothetical protein